MFGVELFVEGDTVYFSEVSPRPHDTGLVTLISQDLSEFALHARAILGLPIPVIRQRGPAASCALLVEGDSSDIRFENVERALDGARYRAASVRQTRGARSSPHGRVARARRSIDEARAKARAMTEALLAGRALRIVENRLRFARNWPGGNGSPRTLRQQAHAAEEIKRGSRSGAVATAKQLFLAPSPEGALRSVLAPAAFVHGCTEGRGARGRTAHPRMDARPLA